MTVINVFKYSPDKLKLHNSAHVDCSVLVSSQVRSRFIRRSSGNVTRVKARQSPLSPPDLAAQLQVEQGQKEAKSAGGKIKSWRFCCLDRSDLTMEKTTTVWWSLMSRWSLELILFTIESIAFVVLASSRAAAWVSSSLAESSSPPYQNFGLDHHSH